MILRNTPLKVYSNLNIFLSFRTQSAKNYVCILQYSIAVQNYRNFWNGFKKMCSDHVNLAVVQIPGEL